MKTSSKTSASVPVRFSKFSVALTQFNIFFCLALIHFSCSLLSSSNPPLFLFPINVKPVNDSTHNIIIEVFCNYQASAQALSRSNTGRLSRYVNFFYSCNACKIFIICLIILRIMHKYCEIEREY